MIPCSKCSNDVFACGCAPERDARDFIEHVAAPCAYVVTVVEDMRALAKFTGVPVLCQFNDTVLMAEPDSTYTDVIREWDRKQQRSYFGEEIF